MTENKQDDDSSAPVERRVMHISMERICPTPEAHAWRNIHGIIKCPRCGEQREMPMANAVSASELKPNAELTRTQHGDKK